MKMQMLGGPHDGDTQDVPDRHPIRLSLDGPALPFVKSTGHKVYDYESDPETARVVYKGERLIMNGEEVNPNMSMKKFGTGQVVETEAEQDTSKTANQDWSATDEVALADENKDD